MDKKSEKAVVSAHEAVDALVEALRLDAEQHDFRIAQLMHEVHALRTENDALKYQVEVLQAAETAKQAAKAAKKASKSHPKDAAKP